MTAMTLAGLETEFGFAAVDREGRRIDEQALRQILDSTRRRMATMPGGGTRLFLQNGGLLYVDTGNHLEWATPETMSPTEVVTYTRSGERLIAEIISEIESGDACAEVRVWKANVDYVNAGSTWGCHESYLYTRSEVNISVHLIPFLVSRIVFTGSGGLNVESCGIEFSLSPRVAHIHCLVSDRSTSMRGVFHTKNETLNEKGHNRLHVICGESNCSQFQTWLKTGTMMIVMLMLDANKRPGDELKLKSALDAMREIAADSTCAAVFERENGKPDISALQVQRFYLEMAEGLLDEPYMPVWAKDICLAWRQTLDALQEDPSRLAGKLDWVLKKQLFERQINNHPTISSVDVPLWNSVVNELDQCLRESPDSDFVISSRFVLQKVNTRGPVGKTIRKLSAMLKQHGLEWGQLDSFIRLRFELCEFDMRFGQLGPKGVFESLDRAGVLDHSIVADEECDRAITHPPSQGRAKIRGNCISRLAAENRTEYRCSWEYIIGPEDILNLGDPFATEEVWREATEDDVVSFGRNFHIPPFLRRASD